MITAREALAITTKEQNVEFYWLNRVERKIRAAAGDGFPDTTIRIYDTDFLKTSIRHLILGELATAGFKATMSEAEDCITYVVTWPGLTYGAL
jgi:hypothetical protein